MLTLDTNVSCEKHLCGNNSGMSVWKWLWVKQLKNFCSLHKKIPFKNVNIFMRGSALFSIHYQQKSFSWAVESRRMLSAHVFLFNYVKSAKCLEYLNKSISDWVLYGDLKCRWPEGFSHVLLEVHTSSYTSCSHSSIIDPKTTPVIELTIFFSTL